MRLVKILINLLALRLKGIFRRTAKTGSRHAKKDLRAYADNVGPAQRAVRSLIELFDTTDYINEQRNKLEFSCSINFNLIFPNKF